MLINCYATVFLAIILFVRSHNNQAFSSHSCISFLIHTFCQTRPYPSSDSLTLYYEYSCCYLLEMGLTRPFNFTPIDFAPTITFDVLNTLAIHYYFKASSCSYVFIGRKRFGMDEDDCIFLLCDITHFVAF